MTEECNTIIKQMLPLELKDLWSFTVPCSIENSHDLNVLIDFGTNINLVQLSIYRKLVLDYSNETSIILHLVDRTFKH